MDTSASAALATVVNSALLRQQAGYSVLKQQGQVATELVAAATQIASGGESAAVGSPGGLGGIIDVRA